MAKGDNTLLAILGIGALALFFFSKKNNSIDIKDKILNFLTSESEKIKISLILDQMNNQELIDTYNALLAFRSGKIIVEPLKSRVEIISEKYNIFT